MNRQAWLRLVAGSVFAILLVTAVTAQRGGVEAFEIGATNTNEMPLGKEADGILGDFVLRNDKVEALIGGNQPDRRANMMTEYDTPTPGTLYDLDLRGAANDQLTALRPGDQRGALNWVRIASDGRDGIAVVEAVRTAAKGNGLAVRHEYRLQPGWQHIVVRSEWKNESREPVEIAPAPVWKEFSKRWQVGAAHVGDAIDPFDKRAYAWIPLNGQPLPAKTTIAPGQSFTTEIAVTVAGSPLAAYGMAAALTGETGEVSGAVRDSGGQPAVHASVLVDIAGQTLPAYPDAEGRVAFRLPAGSHQARLSDLGRPDASATVQAAARRPARLDFNPPPASAVRFNVRDEAGQPSACKVQFLGRNGTATPYLGTDYRAAGCDHQYHSSTGQFRQQLPPGDYLVRITRGPEYDLVEQEITVKAAEETAVNATLRRTVDTRGWVSTDFHAHSTPSGDNYCNTRDRLINFAAEHVEFAPTTEHNRIFDWQPELDRLGLSRQIRTIIGIELTGRGQHFNAFPLKRDPYAQDGGSPKWSSDPRITAHILRDAFDGGSNRWVQANHPVVGEIFNDRNRDGIEDGGYVGFESLVDAAEVWSTEILNLNPSYERMRGNEPQVLENRTFGWLQLLNQGRHMWCVAVSDAHRIFGNGVGSWRTYVPSRVDVPGDIDPDEIIRHSKAGRMMVTNGPFLEVTLDDGTPIGSTVIAAGGVTLKVRVQTPNWMDVDRVQVLVNGRQPAEYNFTRDRHARMFRDGVVNFDEKIEVKLQRDAHLIVVAVGEKSTLEKGWGRSWESGMRPMAYTNPIYVDTDGKGFRPSGDTLGHPILVARAARN
ncbi:MAG: carboxypeptidase regulatory-like domain-containing protein [Bryobacterales bacterium]|nr:carboxypeptidase regulatory-like domain-containing protein [Bryobacterales bacterium]